MSSAPQEAGTTVLEPRDTEARDRQTRRAESSVAPEEHASGARPASLIFVGPVDTDVPGGSVVKNRIILEGLRDHGVDATLMDTIDTSVAGRLRQLAELVGLLARHDQFLLSLNRNGVYGVVPLVALATLLRPRMRVALIGTGSGLPRNVTDLPKALQGAFKWALAKAHPIYVQGEWIKRDLDDLGVPGVRVLPNLRARPPLRWDPAALRTNRITFISRVIPEKGIETAIEAVELLRAEGLDVSMDIYGPIEGDYGTRFHDLVARSRGSVYKGVLKPDLVLDTLTPYAATILPTTWPGEGMPGIILEAGMVGMPVIASSFPAIAEVITDGETGLLREPGDARGFADAIRQVLTDDELAVSMAGRLHDVMSGYTIEAVIERLCRELVEEGWR